MNPAEVVPWITACVAVIGLVISVARSRRTDAQSTQAIKDKLDYISNTTRDTRDDVRDLSRKLEDHNARIVRLEERADNHARRIAKLEN